MIDQHTAKGQTEHAPGSQNDSVELTAEELRSISGGNHISLNLEVEKGPSKNGHPDHHNRHDRRR